MPTLQRLRNSPTRPEEPEASHAGREQSADSSDGAGAVAEKEQALKHLEVAWCVKATRGLPNDQLRKAVQSCLSLGCTQDDVAEHIERSGIDTKRVFSKIKRRVKHFAGGDGSKESQSERKGNQVKDALLTNLGDPSMLGAKDAANATEDIPQASTRKHSSANVDCTEEGAAALLALAESKPSGGHGCQPAVPSLSLQPSVQVQLYVRDLQARGNHTVDKSVSQEQLVPDENERSLHRQTIEFPPDQTAKRHELGSEHTSAPANEADVSLALPCDGAPVDKVQNHAIPDKPVSQLKEHLSSQYVKCEESIDAVIVELAKKQEKLEQQSALDRKLCDLARKKYEMNAGLQSALRTLSTCQTKLLAAKTRYESRRGSWEQCGNSLERVTGAAGLLTMYQKKVGSAIVAVNGMDAHLRSALSEAKKELEVAKVRRNDAKDIHELMLKVRAIGEDITELRTKNEKNGVALLRAQEEEIEMKQDFTQTMHGKLLEQQRHMKATASILSKSRSLDGDLGAVKQCIAKKEAEIESKRAELLKKEAMTIESRAQARVGFNNLVLGSLRHKRDALRQSVADLDADIASKTASVKEKIVEAEKLSEFGKKMRSEQATRKTEIAEATDAANKVDELSKSIKDLTAIQEQNAQDLKLTLKEDKERVAVLQTEISSNKQKTTEAEKSAQLMKEQAVQMDKIAEYNREREDTISQEPILERLRLDFKSCKSIHKQKEEGTQFLRQHYLSVIKSAKAERRMRAELRKKELEDRRKEERAEDTRRHSKKLKQKGGEMAKKSRQEREGRRRSEGRRVGTDLKKHRGKTVASEATRSGGEAAAASRLKRDGKKRIRDGERKRSQKYSRENAGASETTRRSVEEAAAARLKKDRKKRAQDGERESSREESRENIGALEVARRSGGETAAARLKKDRKRERHARAGEKKSSQENRREKGGTSEATRRGGEKAAAARLKTRNKDRKKHVHAGERKSSQEEHRAVPRKKRPREGEGEYKNCRLKKRRKKEIDESKTDPIIGTLLEVPSQQEFFPIECSKSKQTEEVSKQVKRPKLEVFSSTVHDKENVARKNLSNCSKSHSSRPCTQMSGFSSHGGGVGRRRKKTSAKPKMSRKEARAQALQMNALEDDACFLTAPTPAPKSDN